MFPRLKRVIPATAAAVFVLGSAAAAQQAGQCGQPMALTQGSYNISESDPVPTDVMVNIVRGEPGYVEIKVASPMGVTIETTSPDADPVLILFDSLGNVVRADDDGTGSLNAQLGAQLDAGFYCAQVRTLTEIPQGGGALPTGFETTIPMRISAGIVAGSGGCMTQPGLVTLDTPFAPGMDVQEMQGFSGNGGAFAFSVLEDMPLSIGVRSNDFDTILSLEDANGIEIRSDDDGGGGTNSYIGLDTPVPAGDYCVMVRSYDETQGTFSMTMEEYSEGAASRGGGSGAPADPCGDPSMTMMLPEVLGGGFAGQTFTGLLTNSYQFYQFEISEPLTLRMTATSGDFDTILGLYGPDGALVSENDDGENLGTNSRVQPSAALPAGQYCASVGPYAGEGTGGFEFELIELSEEALLAEAYANGDLLPSANSGITFNDLGVLQRSLRSDNAGMSGTRWFLFEVEEESLIVADSASLGNVTRLVLFDYEGTGLQMAESVSSIDGLTTRMVKKVGSGIYALAVVRAEGAGGVEASALSIQRYIRPPRAQ